MSTERIAINIRVPNQTRYLCLVGQIGDNIARTLKHYDGDREQLAYDLNLVLTEAVANAIKHANDGNQDQGVHIEITIDDVEMKIRVYDFGKGFDVKAYVEPRHPLDEHGRGIYLMHTVMDEVSYQPTENGYVLEMCKSLT